MELTNPISKEKLKVDKSKMSVDDIVAWCRAHDARHIEEPPCTPDVIRKDRAVDLPEAGNE